MKTKKFYFKWRRGYGSVLLEALGTPAFVIVFCEMMTFYRHDVPDEFSGAISQISDTDRPWRGKIFPNIKTLTVLTGVKEHTVMRAFAAIRRSGLLIEIGKQGRTTVWEVPPQTAALLEMDS